MLFGSVMSHNMGQTRKYPRFRAKSALHPMNGHCRLDRLGQVNGRLNETMRLYEDEVSARMPPLGHELTRSDVRAESAQLSRARCWVLFMDRVRVGGAQERKQES